MVINKIKILYTIPNFDTAGSGKVVYDLVKELDKEKFEPHIACFHDRGDFFSEVKKLKVPIHITQFAIPYRPFWLFPFRLKGIIRFYKKHRFDVIHSWHWSSDFSEPLAAKLVGIPFVFTKKNMSWGNKSWRWKSQLSTLIVTINSEMKSLFFSKMKSKVVEIPVGISFNYFIPQKKTDRSPEGITIEKDEFVIVSVVNLVPVKGIEILLQAVKIIKEQKIKVFIVGDNANEYGKELKEKYASDTVIFIPKKKDVRPYLALSDLFVIPTKNEGRSEGLGVAPIEAMASERIVIGSRVGGIKDVLLPFQNCMFEPGEVESLKEKIISIRTLDSSDRHQLAKEMRSYAMSKFSKEKVIQQYEEMYINLFYPKGTELTN